MKKSKKNHKVESPNKLPSVWTLIKQTWFETSTFWRPLGLIILVYAFFYFVFVLGLSFSSSLQESLLLPDNRFGEALYVIFGAFGSGGFGYTSQSDSSTLIQFLLFIIASLAFVWTLRKLQGLKQIQVRDAYYLGSSTLIPALFVTIFLILTMVPMIIGTSLFATAVQLSPSGLEIIIITIITSLLVFLSTLLFFMFWPAFYIISLPQTRPIKALRSALKVTKKRRLAIIRKALSWLFICLILMFLILLPFGLFLPAAVTYLVFTMLFILFGLSHIYFYNLYRSLL